MIQFWLLTTEFPPYVGGGIGTYCSELSACATPAGIDLTVFVSDWSFEQRTTVSRQDTVTVVRFNPSQVCNLPGIIGVAQLAHAFYQVVLERIEQVGTPDIIEAQDYLAISYFLLQNKLTTHSVLDDIPICLTLHTPEYIGLSINAAAMFHLPDFWVGEMERFCINAADAVWAPSRLITANIGDEFRQKPITLVRNPFRVPISEEPAQSDQGLYYFGRIQYRKGVHRLIEAYAQLVDEGLNIPLTLVGGDATYPATGGSMMEYLKKRYQCLVEADLLRFTGLLPREEAMVRLRYARVVVMPSIFENYAYTVLEAMALQRVVVTSSNTGHSEIIGHDVSGFLFDHNDRNSLRETLRQALALDEARRTIVGRNARAAVIAASDPARIAAQKAELAWEAIERRGEASRRRQFPFVRIDPPEPLPSEALASVQQPGLLSIVIPFFNLGSLLQEAIENADASDYPHKEILVLNASSTAASSIATFYQLRDHYANQAHIRFEHVADFGLADTRNRGAERAWGEFLTFLDPDDLAQSDYYSRAIAVLQRYDNVGVVGCWVKYFEGDTGQWITWNAEPPYFLFHNLINTASVVFRRAVFQAYGRNDLAMFVGMEDYEAMVRMVSHGYGAVALPHFLFNYRVRADSMMRKLNRYNDIYSYERIAHNNAVLFAKHAVAIAGLLNANGPGYKHDNPMLQAISIDRLR